MACHVRRDTSQKHGHGRPCPYECRASEVCLRKRIRNQAKTEERIGRRGNEIATSARVKTLALWGILMSAPVAFVVPVRAQGATNLLKAPIKWPTIQFNNGGETGSFNESVAAVQYLLRARGFYRGRADGVYGAKTVAAVKAFQRANGLKADGIAGPQTLPKLVVMVRRGSKGDAVRAAQILARNVYGHDTKTHDMGLAIDGVFGYETQKAVRNEQGYLNIQKQTLVVDGIMGPRSWCLMLGGTIVGSEKDGGSD